MLSRWSGLFARSFGTRRVKKPLKEWTIVKGDYVKVVKGTDAGKFGEVLRVIRRHNEVVVSGVNAVGAPEAR